MHRLACPSGSGTRRSIRLPSEAIQYSPPPATASRQPSRAGAILDHPLCTADPAPTAENQVGGGWSFRIQITGPTPARHLVGPVWDCPARRLLAPTAGRPSRADVPPHDTPWRGSIQIRSAIGRRSGRPSSEIQLRSGLVSTAAVTPGLSYVGRRRLLRSLL